MRRQPRATHRAVATSLAFALLLPAAASHAVWQWMRGAALTDFKDSDWTMLKDTARKVLNDLPDHEQANWTNPETGNKGSIMALATFQFEGQKCRLAAMRNITVRGRDDRSSYTLCQQADGDWIFVPESAIREAAATGAGASEEPPADEQAETATATPTDSP